VRQYTFQALINIAVAAGDAGTARHRGEAPARIVRASRLVQPGHHQYFPAVISRDQESLPHSQEHVLVTVALADGEAETLFAPGHCFAIWADGLIGPTVRPDGLVGRGVISRRVSPSPLRQGDGIQQWAVGQPTGTVRQRSLDRVLVIVIRRSSMNGAHNAAWARPRAKHQRTPMQDLSLQVITSAMAPRMCPMRFDTPTVLIPPVGGAA
jgi:hypothetical protein